MLSQIIKDNLSHQKQVVFGKTLIVYEDIQLLVLLFH